MIETITNIPPLITGTITLSVALAIVGGVIYGVSRHNRSWEVAGSGMLLVSPALLLVGAPVAALISGITLGQIIGAIFMGVMAIGLLVIALFAIFLVLFILGSVFVPIR